MTENVDDIKGSLNKKELSKSTSERIGDGYF